MRHARSKPLTVLMITIAGFLAAVFGSHLRQMNLDSEIPITCVDISSANPIAAIKDWRIIGPFLVNTDGWANASALESQMFATDYLSPAGRETPLHLPSKATHFNVDFSHDGTEFTKDSQLQPGHFLNQNISFPTPDVDSKILFWKAYSSYKVIYAAARLSSARDQDLVLLAGANSPLKIWVNNDVAIQSSPGANANHIHIGIRLHVRAGLNVIVVKMLCYPLGNNFSIQLMQPERARGFLDEHGGILELSTRLVITPGDTIRLASVVAAVYGTSTDDKGVFELRNIKGTVIRTGLLDDAERNGINSAAIPDGLYTLTIAKGAERDGEFIFVGDLARRIDRYRSLCLHPTIRALPCTVLPALLSANDSESKVHLFRLGYDGIIVFALEQLETSLLHIPLIAQVNDAAPRVRLVPFLSHFDKTIQYYYVHISPRQAHGSPIPLIVIIPHNAPPDKTMTSIYPLEQYARFADMYGFSFIEPFARGKQMPSPLAEKDVLEALGDIEKKTNIDRGRVYLAGDCAGGRGALVMAENNPEIFSAVSTIRAETGGVLTMRGSRADAGNALLRLGNLFDISVTLVHTTSDNHSPFWQASLLAGEARKRGVFPRILSIPGNGWLGATEPNKEMFEALVDTTRRSLPPTHINLTVVDSIHNHMFWITVNELAMGAEPGTVDACLVGENKIMIESSNVKTLSIDTVMLPHRKPRRHPWTVLWNKERDISVVPGESGRIVVTLH